jgi:hypothetical protein
VIHDAEKKSSEYAVIQYGIKASPLEMNRWKSRNMLMFWVRRQALLTEMTGFHWFKAAKY